MTVKGASPGYFQSERRKSPRVSGPRAATFSRREYTTAVNLRMSLERPTSADGTKAGRRRDELASIRSSK
jgi:hypothetical protein